ncbi:MAG TPA: rRNA (guanine-N1)-methyltransferase [Nakamurella sp.]
MIGPGLAGVLPLLACPHCESALGRSDDRVVGCRSGHRFDVARRGYLSLLGKTSRTDTGDSADMVQARATFLSAGHYQSLASAIAALVTADPVLEIGAGTGYYLAAVLRGLTDSAFTARGLAVDASRYAARRAAADPGIGSIVADAWSRLPVRDGAVRAVLSVFAPRDPSEIARVLRAGGRAVVVTPEPDHLGEIRSPLGLLAVDPGKPDRLAEAFAGRLRPAGRLPIRSRMSLTRGEVDALVRMGPSARHLDRDRLGEAIRRLAGRTAVTLSVTVSVLEKPGTGSSTGAADESLGIQ